MAATGSNHRERHLAQPPGSFISSSAVRAHLVGVVRLHSPFWVAAVLLVAALTLLVPGLASSVTAATGDAGGMPLSPASSNSTVVPILFPLEQRVSWTDTFGDARSGGRTHAGNDLMAPKMTHILAVVDGTLDWMNFTGARSSYNGLPYYNILLRGDDGNDYFYIHLNNDTPGTDDGQGGPENAYAPGLRNGTHVHRGDVIGYVGDSGNAEDVGSHLHFEIHLGGYVGASGGQTRAPSAIDPYASLKAAATLSEWIAAGRPPLTTSTTAPGSGTTTTTAPTTSTTRPPTTTTTAPPTTTTTVSQSTTTTSQPTTTTTAPDTRVAGFRDVRTTDWYYPDFAQALNASVVTPASDGLFHPYSLVSRSLFTVYLVRAIAPGELIASPEATQAPSFKDVPDGYWAYREIQAAAHLGLVQGTGDGTTFSPDSLITRAQMATMICRALGSDPNNNWAGSAAAAYLLYRDVPAGYWAQGAVVMAHYLGLLQGDAKGNFRPAENANRAQAVTLMARVLRLHEGGSGS
ncbi:MAG: S-layer homology domain-containing protein [Actinobacteria bacterium]|nr:S-layer homology domain-containing protein [Actinomycetota bacterium]